ncbi:MAG TPA: heavy-metal-associated domain-containing protein [Anaerolineales bacterium]
MEKKRFEVPALYADHHVTEVRRILLELDGVIDVYASSAFQIVEVAYDENKINDLEIAVKLDEAGYLGEWTAPIETGAAAQPAQESKPYFRHTTVYETTKKTVTFAQRVNYSGRPLWPCPGMGPLSVTRDEEADHA